MPRALRCHLPAATAESQGTQGTQARPCAQVVPDLVTQTLEEATLVREQHMELLDTSVPVSSLRQLAQGSQRAQLASAAARLAAVAHGVQRLHG